MITQPQAQLLFRSIQELQGLGRELDAAADGLAIARLSRAIWALYDILGEPPFEHDLSKIFGKSGTNDG